MPRRRAASVPFDQLCVAAGLPAPVAEYRFDAVRRWRFDWAWPAPHKVALEIDGGAWVDGRHVRAQGFVKDIEKLNAAAVDGWAVLRSTPDDVASGVTLETLRRMLARRTSHTH